MERESHLRLHLESLSWTGPVGSAPCGAVTVVYFLLKAQPTSHERSEFACFGEQQHTPNSTGNTTEDATPQPEQVETMPDNRSMTWDVELEDGILPSDSSSFTREATVVIDPGRNWDDREGTQQPIQPAMDFCGELRSIVTRSSGERSPSLHIASRFFSNYVSSLSLGKDISAPRTPVAEWEDHSDREPEVSVPDDLVDCHCPYVGWGRSPSWEADSFLSGYYGARQSSTSHATLRMVGLTMVDKLIKKGGASRTTHRALEPHFLSQQTPRATAGSETHHLGSVVRNCQIWVHPNRFIVFQRGGDYSGGCNTFLHARHLNLM